MIDVKFLSRLFDKDTVNLIKCLKKHCKKQHLKDMENTLKDVKDLGKEFKSLHKQLKKKDPLGSFETMLSIVDKLIRVHKIINRNDILDCKFSKCKGELIKINKALYATRLKDLELVKDKIKTAKKQLGNIINVKKYSRKKVTKSKKTKKK